MKSTATLPGSEQRATFQQPGHYTAKDRDKIPLSDFGDPQRKKYPIVTQQDVHDAASLIGKAGPGVKERIIRIAKRKGFSLPDAWEAKPSKDEDRTALPTPEAAATHVAEPTVERSVAAPSTVQALFYTPITRRDDTSREIEGVLSNEDVDTFGTIFDYDSMKRAVERWPGNIREQHDPRKAVGKRVYAVCDDEQRQVILRARISTGAEDTWQKILDGTLTGFSIGAYNVGKVEYRAEGSKRIPVYKDYDLAEASVVDVPSNPGAANGLSIFRAATIWRAAALDGKQEDTYGADFDEWPEEPAMDERRASVPEVPTEESPVEAVAAPVAPGSPVDQRLQALLAALQAGQNTEATPDDQRQRAVQEGMQRQQMMAGRAAQDAAIAAGPTAGAALPFVNVNLAPLSASDLAPADESASLDIPAALVENASADPESVRAPSLARTVGAQVETQRAYYDGESEGKDALSKGMEDDQGDHTHAHQHTGSYAEMHLHDHQHQHQDGTTHAHPHSHFHDHHEHYGDEDHSHEHKHLHDHSHSYRQAAPDLSKTQEPYPEQPGKILERVIAQKIHRATGEPPVTSQQTATERANAELVAPAAQSVPAEQPAGQATLSQALAALSPEVKKQLAAELADDLMRMAGLPAPSATRAEAPADPPSKKVPPKKAEPDSEDDEDDEDGEDNTDSEDTDPDTDPAGENASRATLPDETRVGASVSGSNRTRLHSLRDEHLRFCADNGCEQCQDLLEVIDPDQDGDDDTDPALDTDGDGGEGERARRVELKRLQRTLRLERAQRAHITRMVESQVQVPLAAAIGRLNRVAATLTGVQQPTLTRMAEQVSHLETTVSQMGELVALIAQQEQKNQPVYRAVDKVLPTNPAVQHDPSAPGGGTRVLTSEAVQQRLEQYRSAQKNGQLLSQEEQVGAAQDLINQLLHLG